MLLQFDLCAFSLAKLFPPPPHHHHHFAHRKSRLFIYLVGFNIWPAAFVGVLCSLFFSRIVSVPFWDRSVARKSSEIKHKGPAIKFCLTVRIVKVYKSRTGKAAPCTQLRPPLSQCLGWGAKMQAPRVEQLPRAGYPWGRAARGLQVTQAAAPGM